jgi:uncharacterized membrane protein
MPRFLIEALNKRDVVVRATRKRYLKSDTDFFCLGASLVVVKVAAVGFALSAIVLLVNGILILLNGDLTKGIESVMLALFSSSLALFFYFLDLVKE